MKNICRFALAFLFICLFINCGPSAEETTKAQKKAEKEVNAILNNIEDEDISKEKPQVKPITLKTSSKKWYEGGTLHKSKISAWKKATEKNKLATCADFMATVDNSVSMSALKPRAIELKNCIDEATRGIDNTNSEAVSSVAALCVKMLGY